MANGAGSILDIRHERLEVVEPFQAGVDTTPIDVGIVVHQDVAEASEVVEAASGVAGDDMARDQSWRNVAVLTGRFVEFCGEDVVAGVEQVFGGDLETALHGPPQPHVTVQRLRGDRQP
jgi:hypothetical protein